MRANEGFVLRKIYGQCLLMPVCVNEAGNEPIFLNDVGADIWNFALEGLSEDEIVLKIDKKYGLVAGSVEESSIRIFISALCDKKLVYR